LVSQLKLQDPSNPFDSNTMMQQVSQLTNLSSTQELEKVIQSLNQNMSASQMIQAAQLIGKNVNTAKGNFKIASVSLDQTVAGGITLNTESQGSININEVLKIL
jgi:flagellar hook assembly protein FlgD